MCDTFQTFLAGWQDRIPEMYLQMCYERLTERKTIPGRLGPLYATKGMTSGPRDKRAVLCRGLNQARSFAGIR